jgi:hypothetical protein
VYGATIAELLRKTLPAGSNIDVKPRAGGVGNPRLVAKNETPLGLSFTVTNRWAWEGREAYDTKLDNLRALAGGLDTYYLVAVVSKKLPVSSLTELKDKKQPLKLVTQPVGSLGEFAARQLLRAQGLTYADLKAWGGSTAHVGYNIIIDSFRDGRVDTLIAGGWSIFQLYTAARGTFDLLVQLPVHVASAVALGFLVPPTPDSAVAAAKLAHRRPWLRWLDAGCAVLALACAAYYVAHNARLTSRMALVDAPASVDVAVGVLLVLLLLEAARRHIGPALVVLAALFVVYAFAGPWLPGFFSHGGETFLMLLDTQMLTTQGVFWVPTFAHTVDGHAPGALRVHHPLQLRVRSRAPHARGEPVGDRLAHALSDNRHRDARRRAHRLFPRPDAPVGAGRAAGRRPAPDLPRRHQRRPRHGVLCRRLAGAAAVARDRSAPGLVNPV